MEKEYLERQKSYRRKTNNSSTKKYEKTINGFLMRMYRNMKSRIFGVHVKKAHLYYGKELIEKKEFYELAKSNKDFIALYENWIKSNYDRKLSPSVDRINTKIGYTKENIRFITHSENSRLGGMHKKIINGKVL